MSALQIVRTDFQGSEISFTNDGWFDATQAASKYGKRPIDWLNLPSTKEYISVLMESEQSEKISLWVKTSKGGNTRKTGVEAMAGTWLHPKLAVAFSRWLDMRFSIWCDKQIDNILRGKVDMKKMRHEAASSFKVMQSVLQLVREEKGKVTASHHYSNEARLISYSLSGKFQSIDRDALTAAELNQLARLEEKNAVLIGRGVGYDARKKVLEQYAIDIRVANIQIAA